MNPQLNKLIYANWMYCPNIPRPPILSHLSVISNGFMVFKGTPFQKGELHICNRMALFCEVFRDWGNSWILRFRYRQSMFIDYFPERASCFTNIVFITFSAYDKVYDITDLTSFVRRDTGQGVNSMCDFTLDLGDRCYERTVSTVIGVMRGQ